MIIVWILIGISGALIAYFVFGILFQTASHSSQTSAYQEYQRILNELRRHPDSKQLRHEAEHLGLRHLANLRGRDGQTSVSNTDIDSVRQDIEDAVNRATVQPSKVRNNSQPISHATIGCLILLLVSTVLIFFAIKEGKKQSDRKRIERQKQSEEHEKVVPNDLPMSQEVHSIP